MQERSGNIQRVQSPVVLRAMRTRRPRPPRWVVALLPLLLLLMSPPRVVLRGSPGPAAPAPIAAAGTPMRTPTPTHVLAPLAPVDKPPHNVENPPPTVENVPPGSPPTPTATRTRTPTPTATPTRTPTPTPTEVQRFPAVGPLPTPRQLPSIGLPPPRATPPDQQPASLPAALSPPPTPAGTPLPTLAPGTVHILPIIMYHYIREVDPDTDPTGYRLSVAPDTFAAHLDWLAQEGYTPIRMEEVAGCLQGHHACPARPVALTFDDGYADAYTTALPLLQRHGFVATFYIVNSFVGAKGYMTWEQVRALRAAGMEIGAHTRHHHDLTTLSPALANEEIAGAKDELEATIQTPVVSFCYPIGKYDTETQHLVETAGYLSAVTTVQSSSYSDMYALPRIRIDGSYSLDGFASLMHTYTPPDARDEG